MKTCILYLLFLVISGIVVNTFFNELDKQYKADQYNNFVVGNETPECLEDNNY